MDKLGNRILEARRKKKLSLKELAIMVQVTPGFLSQIENGKNQPSLSTLKRISECLDVTISRLMGEEEHSIHLLIKANERNKLVNLGDSGLVIEFLTELNMENIMEANIHCLGPSAKSGVVSYTHEGQEIFYAVKGCMKLEIDGKTYVLDEGDCFYLKNCSLSHLFYNTSDSQEACMMCVATPPYFYSSYRS